MANGRQRKRAVLLAKKEAERKAKLGLAGLSPQALTSVVSDDTNDLDNVSYTTTGGATVSVKNDRNKDTTPTVNILGGNAGNFDPDAQISPYGKTVNGMTYPVGMDDVDITPQGDITPSYSETVNTGNLMSNGSSSRSARGYDDSVQMAGGSPNGRKARGFSFDDELLLQGGPSVRSANGANKQASAITEFIGEDLSPAANKFVTVAMDSEEDKIYGSDNSVLSEQLNDDGTVTYELPGNFGDMSQPEVTTNALTEAQLEPGMYEGIEPGKETALTPTLDNKGYGFDANGNIVAEQSIMHNPNADQRAAAGLSLEEQLKEQELLRALEQETRDSNKELLNNDTTTEIGKGSLENQSVGVLEDGSKAKMHGDIPGYEGVKSKMHGDIPGFEGVDEDLLSFVDRKEPVNTDELYEAPGADLTPDMEFSEADIMDGYNGEDEVAKKSEAPKAAGTSTVGEIAAVAKEAENDVQAATAGDPEKAAIAEDAKTVVEEVKTKVESGEMTAEDAAKTVKGSLGQLGELLGIDGKDLVRGLMRYAGARIFGMSGNEAGRFMYEGFMADEAAEAKVLADEKSNMGLGASATAQQKNLKAYQEEIKRIDEDKTLSAAEKTAAKKTADEMFGVNQGTSMGRPVNIQGRKADGTEEVVAGRRNDNDSYDVYMGGQWIPIEESGLSEVQITGRNANQALEAGAKDMRMGGDGVAIPNAYQVGKDGTPLFKMKTEQAKRYGLVKRAVDNYPIVAAMMANPDAQEEVTNLMGGLQTWAAKNANAAITPAVIAELANNSVPKIYASATSAWLQALLRADTGAAYTGTEIADYIGTNIPAVGDAGVSVDFKLNQMSRATKALIPGAGEAAPYLMGIMDGSIRPDDDAIKGVEIARRAIEEEYGVQSSGSTDGFDTSGLSDEELSAWNAY